MKEGKEKITTEMVDQAIMNRYKEPEWYLGFEVGNSCGSECIRHADAIAICAYPSRGFQSIGFEVKISRSDLQHELDNPSKCEEMYQYVNEWFLVVPNGLTKDMMIPEPWGIMEYDNGMIRQKKKAEYHQAKLTVGFMIAFIRGRQRLDAFHSELLFKNKSEELERQIKWKFSNEVEKYRQLKESIAKIETETGMRFDSCFPEETIRLIRIAQNLKKELEVGNVCGIQDKLNYNLKNINESMEKVKKAYESILPLL